MIGLTRFLTTGLLLAMGLVCLAVFGPGWLARTRDRSAGHGQPNGELILAPCKAAEVHTTRWKAKCQVIDRLETGELSLVEAAACFRALNQEPPEYPDLGWIEFPGRTEEDKHCYQVIRYMKARLFSKVGSRDELDQIARLEAEFADRLGEDGSADLVGSGYASIDPAGRIRIGLKQPVE